MARVFITGSADGLGHLTAKALAEQGHQVVLHARDAERAAIALERVPVAEAVAMGDLSNREQTKRLADEVNAMGPYDAVIHNAGVYQVSPQQILSVNLLAPYILTCLIQKPKRLIYVSSSMHMHGRFGASADLSRISYSDSKLLVTMLAMTVARVWPEVYSNALDPGWVPTKMGGRSAPDSLPKGYESQVWLAASEDEKVKVSGRYFYHQEERTYNPLAADVALQEKLLRSLTDITGVPFPG